MHGPGQTTTWGEEALAATVMERCAALGLISEEPGCLTRRSYTPALRRANDQVAAWMREAGMIVSQDAAGNLFGRYAAATSPARALLIGSHLDTVRDAGRYDGVLGVLIGVATVEALHRQGRRLPFAVEVAAFADEEGLRFGASYLGSLALAGRLGPDQLALRDAEGVSVAEAITAFGGAPDQIARAARRPADLLGYLEVHIEQGPLLEARGVPLGVVSTIAGATRASLHLAGTAGHAGTVPMDLRRDALCAAAEIVLATEAVACATPGLVATVGQIAALPGASNVIPGAVSLSLDLRHQEDPVRLAAVVTLRSQAGALAINRGVTLTWDELQSTGAVPMAPRLCALLAQSVAMAGHDPLELLSGAGHDALVLAGLTEAAMLFVRCKGGVSHHPAESVETADVAAAIGAVGRFLEGLAVEYG